MSDSERREIEELIADLKLVHKTHNELANQGIILYGMTEEDYLNYRLDIMAQIAELQKRVAFEND